MGASAVSHHLEKLKNEELVRVRREGTFLRYTANPAVLEELLGFLIAQCCANTKAVAPETLVQLCQIEAAPSAVDGKKKKKKKEK